jgi:hypothetical protein
MFVFTGSSNQLRILIGLERRCQQLHWLVENKIPRWFNLLKLLSIWVTAFKEKCELILNGWWIMKSCCRIKICLHPSCDSTYIESRSKMADYTRYFCRSEYFETKHRLETLYRLFIADLEEVFKLMFLDSWICLCNGSSKMRKNNRKFDRALR